MLESHCHSKSQDRGKAEVGVVHPSTLLQRPLFLIRFHLSVFPRLGSSWVAPCLPSSKNTWAKGSHRCIEWTRLKEQLTPECFSKDSQMRRTLENQNMSWSRGINT